MKKGLDKATYNQFKPTTDDVNRIKNPTENKNKKTNDKV